MNVSTARGVRGFRLPRFHVSPRVRRAQPQLSWLQHATLQPRQRGLTIYQLQLFRFALKSGLAIIACFACSLCSTMAAALTPTTESWPTKRNSTRARSQRLVFERTWTNVAWFCYLIEQTDLAIADKPAVVPLAHQAAVRIRNSQADCAMGSRLTRFLTKRLLTDLLQYIL
jgi:hypothetical protein